MNSFCCRHFVKRRGLPAGSQSPIPGSRPQRSLRGHKSGRRGRPRPWGRPEKEAAAGCEGDSQRPPRVAAPHAARSGIDPLDPVIKMRSFCLLERSN